MPLMTANLLENLTQAIADYTKAIALDAHLAEAYYNRGLAHMTLKHQKEATADLSKAGELGLYAAYSLLAGAAPLMEDIEAVRAVPSKDALAHLLGKLAREGSDGGFYGCGVEADLADSDNQVLYLGQGGLGMSDRDYYLKAENAGLKAGYKAFLAKVFELS